MAQNTCLGVVLNEDTIPTILRRIGTSMKGDGPLHLLAGMPLRVADVHTNATVSAAATTAGASAQEATNLTNELTKRKAGK